MKWFGALCMSLLVGMLFADEKKELELIKSVTVKGNRVDVKINDAFKKKYLKNDFWARYDDDLNLEQLPESIVTLPFISNVISIVWISGKTYYVDEMDEEFYESMKTVKKVIQRMFPRTKWKGELVPRKLVKNSFALPKGVAPSEPRVALMYTSGIDSTASSLFHRHCKQLLLTINGHWDLPLHDKKLLRERRKELVAWGTKYGHENAFVDSNYYDFLDRWVLDRLSPEITSWRIFTVEGIGWAGLSAPVMALKGYKTLLHASTITWEFNFPAAATPFIDDNIYFGGMHLQHDMFDLNRLQKCELIADICKKEGIERPYTRVCEEIRIENCNRCQKCLRTILELVVIGEDPRDYGFYGDLDEILASTKRFLKKHVSSANMGATTVWHFMHIQERLRQARDRGEPINKHLEWILDLYLKNKITGEASGQITIDWRDYVDFLPGIKVPDSVEPAFRRG